MSDVLDLALPGNDAGAVTVRDYLIELLSLVWEGGEDVIKRPFGNSGWQAELYAPLVEAGIVDGEVDEYGYIEKIDYDAADRLIREAIRSLGKVSND